MSATICSKPLFVGPFSSCHFEINRCSNFNALQLSVSSPTAMLLSIYFNGSASCLLVCACNFVIIIFSVVRQWFGDAVSENRREQRKKWTHIAQISWWKHKTVENALFASINSCGANVSLHCTETHASRSNNYFWNCDARDDADGFHFCQPSASWASAFLLVVAHIKCVLSMCTFHDKFR